jgi:hypothetical protein
MGFAQTNDLVIFSEKGEEFTLYVNSVKQNESPAANVKAKDITGESFMVRIAFNDKSIPEITQNFWTESKNVEISSVVVLNKKGKYVLRYMGENPKSAGNNTIVTTTNANYENPTSSNDNDNDNNNETEITETVTTTVTTDRVPREQITMNDDANINMNVNVDGGSTNVTTGLGGENVSIGMNINVDDENMNITTGVGEDNISVGMNVTGENMDVNTDVGAENVTIGMNVNVDGESMNMTTGVGEDNLSLNMNVNGNSNLATDVNSTTSVTTTTTTTTSSSTTSSSTGNIVVEDNYQTPPVNTYSRCSYAMSGTDFDDAVSSIKSKSFEDSKLTTAKQICKGSCMTAEQIRDINKIFSFEETRLDFAKYAYDYVYDSSKYYKVNDSFTFESSIEDLNEYLESK